MVRTASVEGIAMASPEDVSGLSAWLSAGHAAEEIVAILLKTEGNGLDNDFSRRLAVRAVTDLLAARLGTDATGVFRRVTLLASGGTEGVLSPHMTVFSRREEPGARAGEAALAIGRAIAAPVAAEALGGSVQAEAIAAATADALADAGLSADEAVFAVVKGALPPAGAVEGSGHGLKPALRAASAVGVGIALGDVAGPAAAALADPAAACHRACVTAAADLPASEVLVFGLSRAWAGPFALAAGSLADMLDAPGLAAILARAGLVAAHQLGEADRERLAAVILKGDPPPGETIRGRRHVMHRDSDVDRNRHFRAAMGGLIAALTGETRIYTSAGAERQAPPGGASLAVFARRP